MNIRNTIKTLVAAAVLMVGTAGIASAGDCEPHCYYKKVVTYVCKEVPYEVCITKYDHCGKPYHAYITKYREIEVPVVKLVKVCY